MFILYNPVANEGRFINKLVINRDLRSIYNFINKQSSPNILYIYDRPGQITALNKGAVTYHYAKENWDGLLSNLESGLFTNIIIFEERKYQDDPATNKYNKSNIEIIDKFQSTNTDYIRILKVSKLQKK